MLEARDILFCDYNTIVTIDLHNGQPVRVKYRNPSTAYSAGLVLRDFVSTCSVAPADVPWMLRVVLGLNPGRHGHINSTPQRKPR